MDSKTIELLTLDSIHNPPEDLNDKFYCYTDTKYYLQYNIESKILFLHRDGYLCGVSLSLVLSPRLKLRRYNGILELHLPKYDLGLVIKDLHSVTETCAYLHQIYNRAHTPNQQQREVYDLPTT